MRHIGKIGRVNIQARARIAETAEERGLSYCEARFPGICQGTFGIAPAHRHKRGWYAGDVEKLSDPNEWAALCQPCHDHIETSRERTEELFNRIRPL